ncbi:hypothetical protein OG590_17970 [Streptomyces goshikiensis]|uniref:hypothetical protein n=1 Tax=Streptomyces goshikiensis TaxID=1942 RepID=UPI00386C2E2B|nr:hypothetical protein OG590_17970 [Streptomyces goshikiensis]
MTESWRQRVLQNHRADLNSWLENEDVVELSDDEFESERRANWLDSVRRWNPDAHFTEELVIRLTGSAAGKGGLKFSIGNTLLKPLQEGVTASTDEDIELELVGVSSGSTVLHVRPVLHRESEDEQEFDEQGDPGQSAGQAMAVLFDAMGTVEAREDITEWTPMLSSLSRLVSALDRFDLAVQLRWLADDGSVTSAQLSESGKQYIRELRKSHGDAFTRIRRGIFGHVTEMKLPGTAVIKPPASPAVTVKFEPGQITEVPLALGQEVHLIVEERKRLTRGGGRTITEYLFLEIEGRSSEVEVLGLPDIPIAFRESPDTQTDRPGRAI